MKDDACIPPTIHIKGDYYTPQLAPTSRPILVIQNASIQKVPKSYAKAGSMEVNSNCLEAPKILQKSTSMEVGTQNDKNTGMLQFAKQKLVHCNLKNAACVQHLLLKSEDQKHMGLGNSIPIYSTQNTITLASPISTTNSLHKKSSHLNSEDCQISAKTTTTKRANSAFKSHAEKKWNWGGANGVFSNDVLQKWHGCIRDNNMK